MNMNFQYEGGGNTELAQLRDKLDGNDPSKRKDAAKYVVSLMRAGENMQNVFSSMLRCVKTDDIELKKLVYLYLVHYSPHEPEQAIMAVNTFIKDADDSNPLIRALAIRNMCRIKLENVGEHMIQPLMKSLKDQDPYVRKTAVFGVAKLYDFIPESVENSGLFKTLLSLLKDDNPLVVANTTAVILEINERRSTPIFHLNSETIGPMLSAISSCSEWCQTTLLDSLSHYKPETHEDATFLIDRLIPFLKSSNPAAVIGSFKCIFLFMELDQRNPVDLFPQIIPPFITLVASSDNEIQYVVLRTLSLFVLKYPKALAKEYRIFFCKYNDPNYVKMEKLDILVTICSSQTAQMVLDELQENCNSVDVAFVQKSVRAIGQIAVKIEASARRCVDILVQLVQGKADYALEEAIIVMTDILRKYPGVFENVIGTVCQSLENVKAPRAKAAGIWILGEYNRLIEHVDMLLDPFLDTFHDEEPLVQLQLLVAFVKVYLEKPDQTKDQLQFILNEATKAGNVPDVRQRALLYWKLLMSEGNVAKDVVVFSKDTVVHSGVSYTDEVLTELIRNMGSVSGVLHIVPGDFIKRQKFVPDDNNDTDDERNYKMLKVWIKTPQNQTLECNFLSLEIDYDPTSIYLRITNKTPEKLSNLQFAMSRNSQGLIIAGAQSFPPFIEPQQSATAVIPVMVDQTTVDSLAQQVQLAVNTNAGVVFSADTIPSIYV